MKTMANSKQSTNDNFDLSLISKAIRTCIIGVGLTHGAAQAATITVDTNLDGSVTGCSLREAIVSANTSTDQINGCATGSDYGTDTITFLNSLPSNTITLLATLNVLSAANIEINASTIIGGITIDGDDSSRIFNIWSSTLALDGVTITGGKSSGLNVRDSTVSLMNSVVSENQGSKGGGIQANIKSKVSLLNSSIVNNTATNRGGGIYISNSDTALEVVSSTISNNIANSEGGGVFSRNKTLINFFDSTISQNYADNKGGGIYARESSYINFFDSTLSENSSDNGGAIFSADSYISLSESTVSENSAIYGGGIQASNSDIEFVDSTFSGNIALSSGAGIAAFNSSTLLATNSALWNNLATNKGGGIYASASVELNIVNSTLSGNAANNGGGIYARSSSSLALRSSTISDNSAIIAGGIDARASTSLGIVNSIIANSVGLDCYFGGDTLNTDSSTIVEDDSCGAGRYGDPYLLPLTDNGGATLTHALSPMSPAINTGNPSDCLTIDQRGVPRDSGLFFPVLAANGNIATIVIPGECEVGAFELDADIN